VPTEGREELSEEFY